MVVLGRRAPVVTCLILINIMSMGFKMSTGLGVGTIMCGLALATGTPLEPLPLLWIMTSARWAYGADRYIDGKTDDSPELLILTLASSVFILDALNLPEWGLVEASCIQLYGPLKRTFPLLKPVYVGTLWSGAITVVPHLISHVDIINSDILSMALLTMGVSNSADIKDVDEDRRNGIHTIPVMFGEKPTRALSACLFAGSAYTSGIFMKMRRPFNISCVRQKTTSLLRWA